MPKHSLFLLLFAVVSITAQVSCARLGTRGESNPPASASASEQARIDEILQRYEDAIGGKEAIAGITSYRIKGTFELPGMTGKMEGWRKAGKSLSVIEFPRIGTLKKGFDGETHWVQTPAGTFTDSNPQEIAELERDAEVFSAGTIKDAFDSMKLENKARLHGRDVYVIEGKPERGPAEKLFFDVESGLLLRWDMARKHEKRGTVFVKAHLDEYQQVDNVKVPFKIRFAFESFNFTVKLEDVQHNVAIDDAIFRRP